MITYYYIIVNLYRLIKKNMKKILLSFILITILNNAKAQNWIGNTTLNNPIVTTSPTTAKSGLVSINDGNNNMIIAWVDARNASTTTDIYIQKINKDGSLPWGQEKVVCDAANAQANISMISDGAGGAIIAWGDKRAGTGTNDEQVYGQKINADGTIAWATNGVNLAKSAVDPNSYRRNPILAKVSATEFIVVFAQLGTLVDFFAQKCLIADGSAIWATDTDVHGAQTGTQTAQQVLPDGTGGAFVVWGDPRLGTSNADIYGQRIDASGAVQWGASGSVICNALTNQTAPVMVSDGSGGIICAWTDFKNGNNDIYAQRINANGARQWDVGVSPASDLNGVPIAVISTTSINNQVAPQIINDLYNNFVITWTDNRNALTPTSYGFDIYAQKIDLLGAPKWTVNGVPVVARTGTQGNSSGGDVSLNNSTNGDVFVTFRDVVPATTVAPIIPSNNDIYVQKLNSSDGSISSPFNSYGLPVSTNNATLSSINTISDGNGGLIVAWSDSRNGTEIYASRMNADGTLPVKFSTIGAQLNSNQTVAITWKVASEINTEKYTIEKAGENGNFYSLGSLAAAKIGTYTFTDLKPVLGNNYYRIKAVDFDGAISLSAIATIKVASLNLTSITIYPNPTKDNVNLSFSGSEIENKLFTIQIIDLTGKVRSSQKISATTNAHVLIKMDNLPSGMYTILVIDLEGKTKETKSVIKL